MATSTAANISSHLRALITMPTRISTRRAPSISSNKRTYQQ